MAAGSLRRYRLSGYMNRLNRLNCIPQLQSSGSAAEPKGLCLIVFLFLTAACYSPLSVSCLFVYFTRLIEKVVQYLAQFVDVGKRFARTCALHGLHQSVD